MATACSTSRPIVPTCQTTVKGRPYSSGQTWTSRQQRVQFRGWAAGAPVAASSSASLVGRRLPGARNGSKWTCAQWLENSAEAVVDVPLEDAWDLWEDRELIPSWMPWISSVKVLPEDPRMSRWTLSWDQWDRHWEFSWLAQNLTPMRHQKIHWRSVPGSVGGSLGGALEVQNRGQVRFLRKGPTSCAIKLTISYEVPSVMGPFGNLLKPVVEGVLQKDMQRFAAFALERRQAKLQQQEAGSGV